MDASTNHAIQPISPFISTNPNAVLDKDTYIELITPEIAARYLATAGETVNRRIRPGKLDTYKQSVRTNHWDLTHQGIAFDTNGVLCDGRHRLTAIIETGVPARLRVTYNLPPKMREHFDIGATRTYSDVLAFRELTDNPHFLAAMIGWVYLDISGGFERKTFVGYHYDIHPDLKDQIVNDHPDLAEIANRLSPIYVGRKRLLPIGIHGWLLWRMSRINPEKADKFDQLLRGKSEVSEASPVAALRSTLITGLVNNERLDGTIICALCVKAWNAFYRNRPVKRLSWTATEPFPRFAF